jgi:hypothetical protein
MTLRLLLLSLLALPFLFSSNAHAQQLLVGSGEALRGGTVDVPVRFVRDKAGTVVGFDLDVVYDPSRLGTPVCIAHHGAMCTVHPTAGRVTVIAFNWSLAPLATANYVTLRFPVDAGAPLGTALLGLRYPNFADRDGRTVRGTTLHSGQIHVR